VTISLRDMAENEEPRFFYVSMIRGGRTALLAGPFDTHQEALDFVSAARDKATDIDPWACFDLFGTCSTVTRHRRGVLNRFLGIEGKEAQR